MKSCPMGHWRLKVEELKEPSCWSCSLLLTACDVDAGRGRSYASVPAGRYQRGKAHPPSRLPRASPIVTVRNLQVPRIITSVPALRPPGLHILPATSSAINDALVSLPCRVSNLVIRGLVHKHVMCVILAAPWPSLSCLPAHLNP